MFTFASIFTSIITSFVISKAIQWLAPKPELPDFTQDADAQGVLVNKQSNNANIPVIYGKRLVGGTRVFLETSGADNQYLYGALVLCEGEINAITKIKVDDADVTFDGAYTDSGTIGLGIDSVIPFHIKNIYFYPLLTQAQVEAMF